MPCTFATEQRLIEQGSAPVVGVDEAGRGPLAGPVVAAAVILPIGFDVSGLDDSKKLTSLARNRLYDHIVSNPLVSWATAHRDPPEIDRLNILGATHAAMREAVLALNLKPRHALIDGLPVHPFPIPQTALVRGDASCSSIAAASIVAKVTRDRLMNTFARDFPGYGFEQHKGYATAAHLASLREHGPCAIHRRSFAPVAQLTH